jgi:hypothetical protein
MHTRQVNWSIDGSRGGVDYSEKEGNEMKGRILKIKTGYNPNSSSIGADIIVFFTAGAAMTVLFNTLAAVLAAAKAEEEGRVQVVQEEPVLTNGEKQG